MKLHPFSLLPLAALVLIGATTAPAFGTASPSADTAANLGLEETSWGKLPRFYQPALVRWSARVQPPRDAVLNGTVDVDVLIARNGKIKDVRVIQPSGDQAVDREVTRMLRAARVTARINAPGIDRYVTRYQATFRTPDVISMDVFDGVSPPPRPFLTLKSIRQMNTAPTTQPAEADNVSS